MYITKSRQHIFQKCFKNKVQHHLEKWDRIKRNTLIGRMNMVALELLMLRANSMLQKLHG